METNNNTSLQIASVRFLGALAVFALATLFAPKLHAQPTWCDPETGCSSDDGGGGGGGGDACRILSQGCHDSGCSTSYVPGVPRPNPYAYIWWDCNGQTTGGNTGGCCYAA